MNKYQFKVPEIHCSGCVNLIKLTLEDDFKNVEVDENSKEVIFESEGNFEKVTEKLRELFDGLKDAGYTWEELQKI